MNAKIKRTKKTNKMLPSNQVKLSNRQQLKLELYREFGDDAQEVYDFIKDENEDAQHQCEKVVATTTETTGATDGIYLVYADGNREIFNGENSKDNVRYVGVKLGGKAVCVALKDLGNYQWLKDGAESSESELSTDNRDINALEDFDGARNTDYLRTLDTEIPLDKLADGEYIPACGELGLLMMFKSAVNEALEYVGGETLDGWYWSSTEYSSYAWNVYFSSGFTIYSNKYYSNSVRAVAAF